MTDGHLPSLDQQREALRAQLGAQRQRIAAQLAPQLASRAARGGRYPRSVTMRLLIARPDLVGRIVARLAGGRGTTLVPALLVVASALIAPAAAATAQLADASRVPVHRQWVIDMKAQPRGPFAAIRWYCRDGAVVDPTRGNCSTHGGGIQHGEWSARTRELRAAGYHVGTLLATLDAPLAAGTDALALQQLLVERFLVGYDDGWIFRGARSYRGALQDDDERAAGRALLLALLGRDASSFLLAREAARLLPHDPDAPLLGAMRAQSAALDARDPRFHGLRSQIHNAPAAGDAVRVRAYAARLADPALRAGYAELAATIDRAFAPSAVPAALARLLRVAPGAPLEAELHRLAARNADTGDGGDDAAQLAAAAAAGAWLRDHLAELKGPGLRLVAIDASLATEAAVMAAGSRLLATARFATRRQRLHWLGSAGTALYGAGLLSARELAELAATVAAMPDGVIGLADYRQRLEYLDRVAGWCSHRLDFELGDGIERLAPIEPLAAVYGADRLRGSPLLFYSQVLQSLRDDADQLAQARHSLFGVAAGGQLRRLNPGLARGILRTTAAAGAAGPAIYLVPATTADLPPAAGILTLDEGNPLSHVQLLARNLGIPNVVIARSLLPALTARRDRRVVVAASSGGLVQIADDGPAWDRILGAGVPASPAPIVIDFGKLELSRTALVSTAALRAGDSGRIVGPKAAQVGELTHRFPQMASPGLAVPFGAYRDFLQQPVRPDGPAMFDWMQGQYAALAVQRRLDPGQHDVDLRAFLAFVRGWITARPLAPALREALFDAMHDRFGMSGTYGAFVRSDTNVEDLPGFTGAGLNLTVPNVVGFDATVAALQKVWASPFTERAWGWRQNLMDEPQHVYVSVLLHRSVRSEKSGVMITADIDSGDARWLTVVTSLGVGGGVDGDAAETLRVDAGSGAAQLLGSATARRQRVLLAAGGAQMVPSAAVPAVLQPAEIAQLVALARALPAQYPELRDGEGVVAPADIEFGFVGGHLVLLQIRPFLQNRAAAGHRYLIELDRGLASSAALRVDLSQPPPERAS